MCGAESLPQHSPTDDTIHHTHTCKGTHTRTHTHRRTQLLYKAFKQLLRIPIPQNHTYIHAHFPSHPVVHDDFKLLHKGAHFCTHKCTRKSKHTQACVCTHTHTHTCKPRKSALNIQQLPGSTPSRSTQWSLHFFFYQPRDHLCCCPASELS